MEFKTTMKSLFFSFAFLFVVSVSAPAASAPANLRVATFQCDGTPVVEGTVRNGKIVAPLKADFTAYVLLRDTSTADEQAKRNRRTDR